MIHRIGRLAVLIAWAALAVSAQAANTTITFDALTPGTPVQDQYLAQGVAFGDAASFGFGDVTPECTAGTPTARAGGVVAFPICNGLAEFPRYATMGAFNSVRSTVSMRIFAASDSGQVGQTAVLRVYDFRRNLLATDITFILQESTTLSTWSTATPSEEILSDDGLTRVIKAKVPVGTGPAKYLRLRAQRP